MTARKTAQLGSSGPSRNSALNPEPRPPPHATLPPDRSGRFLSRAPKARACVEHRKGGHPGPTSQQTALSDSGEMLPGCHCPFKVRKTEDRAAHRWGLQIRTTNPPKSMGESRTPDAKRRKPHSEGYILHDSSYMTFEKRQNERGRNQNSGCQGLGGGGGGEGGLQSCRRKFSGMKQLLCILIVAVLK